jgi:RNA polymerase sigma-70 factor (ECF subfamily)
MDADLVLRAGEWDSVVTQHAAEDLETRFAELVARQSRFVFRVAYAVLRNADDAEDVVQDTFLKLFKNKSWTDIQDERAFLARAAWRLAINRKPRGRNTSDLIRETTNPEHAASESQRTARLHTLIDSLPEKLRRPLALSALDELSVAEIAAMMGEPEGTVRRRIAEARALLKQKWERMERHV